MGSQKVEQDEWLTHKTNHQILSSSSSHPEKAMAPHSSTLAWRLPGTGEPGGLPPLGSHRVGHYWGDLAAAAASPHLPIKMTFCQLLQLSSRTSPVISYLNYSNCFLISPPHLPASALASRVDPLYNSQTVCVKSKSGHITSLLNIFQWLPYNVE